MNKSKKEKENVTAPILAGLSNVTVSRITVYPLWVWVKKPRAVMGLVGSIGAPGCSWALLGPLPASHPRFQAHMDVQKAHPPPLPR